MSLEFKSMYFLVGGVIALIIGIFFSNIFVGLAITLVFGIYTLMRPKNALILLFLYVPVRPFVIQFNPGLKGIADIIILLAFFRIIYDYRKNWKELLRFHWFEIAFFLFCFLGALSAYLTGVSLVAIIFQLRAFVLFYLAYYIIRRLRITKEDIKKFLWTTVFVVILICIEGLIEKIAMKEWLYNMAWDKSRLSPTNVNRIYGLTGNPNTLAFYLSLSLIPLIYLRSFYSGKIRWVINVSLVLLFSVWVLTYSRGTWIAFIISMIIYVVLTRNWSATKNILTTFVIAVVIICLPMNVLVDKIEDMNSAHQQTKNQTETDDGKSPKQEQQIQNDEDEVGFSDRVTGLFSESYVETSSQIGRVFYIIKGFEIFVDHPIIGTGFATFGDSATLVYGSPIYDKYNIGRRIYSDNQYIQIIAQTGILGVILYAIFLLNMLYLIWKKRKETALAPALFAVLLGAYVSACYYNVWENDRFTLYYFALLGFLLNYKSRNPLPDTQSFK